MKRLLPLLLLLAPLAAHAQFASVNCAPATPCSSTTGPANTGTGDPAWKAYGKLNENFSSLGSVTNPSFSAITSGTNTTANMVIGTGASLTSTGSGSIDADTLNGSTFATPSPIGSVTPNSGIFSSLTVASPGVLTLGAITGQNQCLHVNAFGTVSGTAADCSSGSGTVDTGNAGYIAYYQNNGATVDPLVVGTGLGINNGTLVPVQAINPQTGTTYTIQASDGGQLVTFSNAASVAVTLPQGTGNFGAGFAFDVYNKGAGTVTITPTTSTINGASSLAIATNAGCSISSDGTNYQVSACTAVLGTAAYQSFSAPPAIGNVTPAAGSFTTLSATGNLTTNVTGSTQCLHVNSSGVVSGAGSDCGGSGTTPATFHSFGEGTVAQASTVYLWYNENAANAAAVGGLAPVNGTLKNLYIYSTNTPNSGQTFTFTVASGTAGSTATGAITCQITNGNHTCNDTTHTISLTAGQQYNVQLVTSATSGNTGVMMVGLEYTSP